MGFFSTEFRVCPWERGRRAETFRGPGITEFFFTEFRGTGAARTAPFLRVSAFPEVADVGAPPTRTTSTPRGGGCWSKGVVRVRGYGGKRVRGCRINTGPEEARRRPKNSEHHFYCCCCGCCGCCYRPVHHHRSLRFWLIYFVSFDFSPRSSSLQHTAFISIVLFSCSGLVLCYLSPPPPTFHVVVNKTMPSFINARFAWHWQWAWRWSSSTRQKPR